MSLTLELSPVQETELQAAARREGMPVEDYAHYLLVTALHQKQAATLLAEPPDWEVELKWAQGQARESYKAVSKVYDNDDAIIPDLIPDDEQMIADTEEAVDAYRAEVYAQKQRQNQIGER